MSTHAAPQLVCPTGQPHTPALQVWPAAQALLQLPQLSGSLWNDAASRQPVPHWACPAGQLATHCEVEHSGVAGGQAVPQLPQFAPSALVFTQPFAHALRPAWHMQVPLQIWPALQTVPQAPQFATSLLVFTQAGPQAANGAGQVQAPLVHVWPAPQPAAHWPALPPVGIFPPVPRPPAPAVLATLPPLC